MKQLLCLGLAVICASVCSVARGQDSVTLAWDSSSNPAVAGYTVYYGNVSGGYTVSNNVGTNTTVTITNLHLGTNYFFAVACYSATGAQSPLSAEVTYVTAPVLFMVGQESPTNNVEWLQFANGTPFGYFSYEGFPWIYHEDMGYEYVIDANDGQAGMYMFDLTSGGFFYSSPDLFPYLYDFSSNSWLYYYPDPNNPGHYTSNPRTFYDYGSQMVITK